VPLRRVLDRDEMIANSAEMTKCAHRLAGVFEQGLLERLIKPSLGDDLCAIVGSDLGLICLDDGIECGRIDIAFFGQDGFERADPQLHL
jgi:hypothetical protein